MYKNLLALAFCLLASLASVADVQTAIIHIRLDGLWGPKFNVLLNKYNRALSEAGIKIDDIKILGKNGAGQILMGDIYYKRVVPSGHKVKNIDIQVDGMWGGDIFDQIRTYMMTLKIQHKTIVGLLTQDNGAGKPIVARIEYLE